MTNQVSLRELFLRQQAVMIAQLQASRSTLPHPGTKGDATELHWIEMLAKHLPRRYCVRKAQVMDHTGTLSEAMDIVIYDAQYSPLLLEDGPACYVPAESVYAVAEVRQELDKGNIEYAGGKAASVRALKRTSAPILHAGGRYEAKKPGPILAGLLTLESSWSPPFGESFIAALKGLKQNHELQFGCAMRPGAWEALLNDEGKLVVSVSDAETALISFFLALLASLQQLATVPAIDLSLYAKALIK